MALHVYTCLEPKHCFYSVGNDVKCGTYKQGAVGKCRQMQAGAGQGNLGKYTCREIQGDAG